MSFSRVIPPQLPKGKLAAALFYRDHLGWAIHPLHWHRDPNIPANERGKKPLKQGWKTWSRHKCTDEIIREFFGGQYKANLGVVVRAPHVCVDLDSKADEGKSVREWLAKHPELAAVPRERTFGGVHIHFVCPDLPPITKGGKPYLHALVAKINDAVNAELYSDGLNIVVSPSMHPKGRQYEWEVTGEIPEVPWERLKKIFGFKLPDETAADNKAERDAGKKAPPWWAKYKGDLRTLDLAGLFNLQSAVGENVKADENKTPVRCPWHEDHSNGKTPWDPKDTSTVIFAPDHADEIPGFACLHAHCSERKLEHVLAWFEQLEPGIVDRHCTTMRVWQEGQKAKDERPRVLLPGEHRPDSKFATEVSAIIGPKREWFQKAESVVEVRQKVFSGTIGCLAFHPLKPSEVCTAVENFVEVGFLSEDEAKSRVFTPCSMSKTTAEVLIHSPQFKGGLPRIDRILGVPIPVMHEGQLVFPKLGYDERFNTFSDPNGPKIVPMSFDEAKAWLIELCADFSFDGEQSRVHAFARLITPACRGLMGWGARPPFWLITANRERVGKDCFAGLTGIIYDGFPNEDAPIEPGDRTETRKRITAAIMVGRPRMHFANCRGHIKDAALEQAITSKVWSDRVLGGNTDITLPNELEFSMSGNIGIGYTADLHNRCRRVGLFFAGEHPNERRFKRPNLHGWLMERRSEALSSIMALINHWFRCGCPSGETPFASFPEWARVVGGVMQAASLGNPCLPDLESQLTGGDEETAHMKILFAMAHDKWSSVGVEVKDIITLIQDEEASIFGWLKLDDHSGKTSFGKLLRRFEGRILGEVVLRVRDRDKKRQTFSFQRVDGGTGGLTGQANPPDSAPVNSTGGDLGDIGGLFNSVPLDQPSEKINLLSETHIQKQSALAEAPKAPNPPKPGGIRLLTDRRTLDDLAKTIQEGGQPVALDLETYGPRRQDALDAFHGEIRLLILAIPGREPWLLDLRALGYNLGPLKPVLEGAEIIGHHVKFDALWLLVKCGIRLGNVFCTLTASRLLTNGSDQKNGLGECIRRHLGIELAKDQGKSDWGKLVLSSEQLFYAVNDVLHLHALKASLADALAKAELDRVSELEMNLLPVVVAMEARGIVADREKLRLLHENATRQAEKVRAELQRTVNAPEFNPNSPAQLIKEFAAQGVTLTDTSKETLAKCDHPFAVSILKYREAKKQAEQAETFLQAIGSDGRIHASFNPLGADTGRFSSSEPNLQNVGRGKELRACFVAAAGHTLVIADYSQIELRAAAAIANETRMLQAYKESADLHVQTASLVLNKPVEEVTKQDRQLAKAVNFGLIYGQSAAGLVAYAKTSYGVELTEQEATTFRSRFFSSYSGFKNWHDRSWNKAKNCAGEVRTRAGRRRLLPKEAEMRWGRFTGLVNTVVQGGCADGLKYAMVDLAKRLPPDASLVSTVHDEIIVEVLQQDAEQVKDAVRRCMTDAMARLFPEVPIEVEVKIASSWADK